MLEKIVPVTRVEVFIDKQEAIVELKTPAVRPVSTLLWYDTDVVFIKYRMQDGCC
jgi:hypothetical protein